MIARILRVVWMIGVTVVDLATLYVRRIVWYTLLAICLPLPFALIGIVAGQSWLTASAGIAWIVLALAAYVFASPLLLGGIALDRYFVAGGYPVGTGTQWLRGAARIVWAIAQVSIILSIVPINKNYAVAPFLILCVLFLIARSVIRETDGRTWDRIMTGFTIFFLVMHLFGMVARTFFPESTRYATENVSPDKWLVEAMKGESSDNSKKKVASASTATSAATSTIDNRGVPTIELACGKPYYDEFNTHYKLGATWIHVVVFPGPSGCKVPIVKRPEKLQWGAGPYGVGTTQIGVPSQEFNTRNASGPIEMTRFLSDGTSETVIESKEARIPAPEPAGGMGRWVTAIQFTAPTQTVVTMDFYLGS